jgi:hypothetical protein
MEAAGDGRCGIYFIKIIETYERERERERERAKIMPTESKVAKNKPKLFSNLSTCFNPWQNTLNLIIRHGLYNTGPAKSTLLTE